MTDDYRTKTEGLQGVVFFNQCEGDKGKLAALLWIENTPEAIATYMAERMK